MSAASDSHPAVPPAATVHDLTHRLAQSERVYAEAWAALKAISDQVGFAGPFEGLPVFVAAVLRGDRPADATAARMLQRAREEAEDAITSARDNRVDFALLRVDQLRILMGMTTADATDRPRGIRAPSHTAG